MNKPLRMNNKKSKKLLIVILTVIIIIAALFGIKACSKNNKPVVEVPKVQEVAELPTETTKEVVEEPITEETVIKEEVKDNTTLSYWVNFLNKDGSVLQRTVYKYGETPSFNGTTPTYTDYAYYYSFKGWEKQTSPVKGTQTYTALYDIVGEVPSESSEPTVTPNYLTFTANTAGSTISFSWSSGSNVMTSTDGGDTWSPYTAGTTITLNNVGDKVSFKGNNCTTICMTLPGIYLDYRFRMTGSFDASGDVTSLTNGVGGNAVLSESCYSNMFDGCESLKTAPNLPSKTLAKNCYNSMFARCLNLEKAPDLKAEIMEDGCYMHMFDCCKKLTAAPKLPAKQLSDSCYYQMFCGCDNLKEAPILPATQLYKECYYEMFKCCTSLKVTTSSNQSTPIFTCPSTEGLTSPVTGMFSLPEAVEPYAETRVIDGTTTGTPVAGSSYYWYTSD